MEYGAEHIEVLEGLEPVRIRPGMYIGSIDSRGLHHLIWEIVNNSVDEALAGHCKCIRVTVHEDESIEVDDDGRGIPVSIHPKKGIPTVDVIFMTLHAGGKFKKGGGYKKTGGLHGVGSSVVNALSEYTDVTVYRKEGTYFSKYVKGVVVEPSHQISSNIKKAHGTNVKFKPDANIFDTTTISANTVMDRLKELAYLNTGVKFIFEDKRGESTDTVIFEYTDGVKGLCLEINDNPKLSQPIHINNSKRGMDTDVELAMMYTKSEREISKSYVNGISTIEGGSHVKGFKLALLDAINKIGNHFSVFRSTDEPFRITEISDGLTYVLSIKCSEPLFEGQTKAKLDVANVAVETKEILSDLANILLEADPEGMREVVTRLINLRKAREDKKNTKKSTKKDKDILAKLTQATNKIPAECEIFLVEGDSAGGSAIKCRKSNQAILPLRGKSINAEKVTDKQLMANNEVRALIAALGCGIGTACDPGKLRYHKIIIMSDADSDGGHIRSILLALFTRLFYKLIEGGYIYIAQPPLYSIEYSDRTIYVSGQDELNLAIANNKGQYQVRRFKGLGEMNPEELFKTTMDPQNRILVRMTDKSGSARDKFNKLMGDDTSFRKLTLETRTNIILNE